MKMSHVVVATAIVLVAPVRGTAEELADFDFKTRTTGEELEIYRTDLYSIHQACAAAALQRPMSIKEAELCGEVFLELKLTFLNGVTRERYRAMPARTWVKAHDMSYAAYRACLHRQIVATGAE